MAQLAHSECESYLERGFLGRRPCTTMVRRRIDGPVAVRLVEALGRCRGILAPRSGGRAWPVTGDTSTSAIRDFGSVACRRRVIGSSCRIRHHRRPDSGRRSGDLGGDGGTTRVRPGRVDQFSSCRTGLVGDPDGCNGRSACSRPAQSASGAGRRSRARSCRGFDCERRAERNLLEWASTSRCRRRSRVRRGLRRATLPTRAAFVVTGRGAGIGRSLGGDLATTTLARRDGRECRRQVVHDP